MKKALIAVFAAVVSLGLVIGDAEAAHTLAGVRVAATLGRDTVGVGAAAAPALRTVAGDRGEIGGALHARTGARGKGEGDHREQDANRTVQAHAVLRRDPSMVAGPSTRVNVTAA